MFSKLTTGILVSIFALTSASAAMELTDLEAGQRVDWTRAGYPGEIPT